MLRDQQESADGAAGGQREFDQSGLHAPLAHPQRNQNLEKVQRARSAHFPPRPRPHHEKTKQTHLHGHVGPQEKRKSLARPGHRPQEKRAKIRRSAQTLGQKIEPD